MAVLHWCRWSPSLHKPVTDLVTGQLKSIKRCTHQEILARYKKKRAASNVFTWYGGRNHAHLLTQEDFKANAVPTQSEQRRYKKKKKNLPGKKLTKHYCGPTWKNSSTKYSTTGKTSGHQGSGWPAQNATADDWQKMAFDITTSLVMDRSFTTKVYQQAGMERIILRSWGVRSVPVEKTRNFLDKKKRRESLCKSFEKAK